MPFPGGIGPFAPPRWEGVRHRYDATSAPGVSNDRREGYGVGSFWFDITNGRAYVCLGANVGAASWQLLTGKGIHVSVTADTTKTIANNTYTQFNEWGTSITDPYGFWSSGAQDRLTVPTGLGGRYIGGCSMSWDTNTAGVRILVLTRNGSILNSQSRLSPSPGNIEQQNVMALSLTAGQYFGAQVYQNSGADRTCPESSGASRSHLWLARIGD